MLLSLRGKSLRFRLLLAEGLVLGVFFVLVAFVLERGFKDSAEHALKDRLKIQAYSLLSIAETTAAGDLAMPRHLGDPRLESPGSGVYAFMRQGQRLLWHSPSALGLRAMPPPAGLMAGGVEFYHDGQRRYVLHYAGQRKDLGNGGQTYLITVAEDEHFINHQVRPLQAALRIWLSVIAVALVSIQFALLRWSLRPLRLIGEDLAAVESGHKRHLDGVYPEELHGLVGNLNAFINIERAHLERYRNNLADLAHSLKTPLAILRGCAESLSENRQTVHEQISRIDEIVGHQLQRAAAKGEYKTMKTADLVAIINKIVSSLAKVYRDKHIDFTVHVPETCLVYCEQGDLYEIVGNLLDNACKWCRRRVKVSVLLKPRTARRDFTALLLIEDDGSGIPAGKFNEILKRGVRADENINGHGIGMSVVYELIGLVNGRLEGGTSEQLGGMRWSVYLP